jgi:hypothetical protein
MNKQRRENNLTTNNKIRKCDLGNVDQALLEWFKVQRNAGYRQKICVRAREFHM